jgi:tRNA nucleotidyltransferase (CCA-adding enzyme)
MNSVFTKAIQILHMIERAGYEAYFVGGSVRDYLLKRDINDVDIASSATPEEIMQLFPKYVPVGLQHGTVMVLHENDSYEVTTFRTEEGYADFRRPSSVTFVRSLYEDLKRRDFTMNAIAMTREGEIIDPFHGEQSIHMKEIKTVGEASERFFEDALRMMRGVRFVSTLGFSLEQQTKEAIVEHASLLQHIAIERITIEFEKLLMGQHVQTAIQLLIDTKLVDFVPELAVYKKSLYTIHNDVYMVLPTKAERWALLFYTMGITDPAPILRKWKLSNKEIKKVKTFVQSVYELEKKDWDIYSLYMLGKDDAIAVERIRTVIHGESLDENIARVVTMYTSLPIATTSELEVNGKDVLKWIQRPGGPWIAELLHVIEREVLSGKLPNDKEKIREWVYTWDQK